MSRKNNNPRGIILILLAMMVFSVQDGIMKHIYSFVSLYEVYLIRTVVSFILILFFLILTKKPIVFKTQYPFLTFLSCNIFLFWI
jgi:drug/metabolite transporter (DMT)-like permease